MEATGAANTVNGWLPLTPSAVAETVAVPVFRARTRPLLETRATASSELLQLTERERVLPRESFGVAENCTDAPTSTVFFGAVTATEATGNSVTVKDAAPTFPSIVALIVVVPAETDVIRPFALISATAGAVDSHVTARPTTAVPDASIAIAVACKISPIRTVVLGRLTAAVATTGRIGAALSLLEHPIGTEMTNTMARRIRTDIIMGLLPLTVTQNRLEYFSAVSVYCGTALEHVREVPRAHVGGFGDVAPAELPSEDSSVHSQRELVDSFRVWRQGIL